MRAAGADEGRGEPPPVRRGLAIAAALLGAACLLSPGPMEAQEVDVALRHGSPARLPAPAVPEVDVLPAPAPGGDADGRLAPVGDARWTAGVGAGGVRRLPLRALPVEELRAGREDRSGVVGSVVRLGERVFGSRGLLRWGEFDEGDGCRLRVRLQVDDPGVRFVLVTS